MMQPRDEVREREIFLARKRGFALTSLPEGNKLFFMEAEKKLQSTFRLPRIISKIKKS